VEHFYIKFGDPSCISFSDIVWKNTERTDKHINTAENRTHVSTGNKMLSEIADLAQVPPPDELEKAYTSPLILAHSLYYVN